MRWGQSITVTAGTSQSSPETLRVKLSLGIIERGVVFFPPGCHGYVHIAFFHREHQFLPNHPRETIAGDDYVFDMALDYELSEKPANIEIVTWNEDTTNPHTIQVQVFVRTTGVDRIRDAITALFLGGGG